jgi:heme/copper-type cytochrome/quinol oxidase subunit 2
VAAADGCAALRPLGDDVNRDFHLRVFAVAALVFTILLLAPGIHSLVTTVWGQEAHRAPVELTVTARKYSFSPARIEVEQDDIVKITLRTEDIPHSFTIDQPYLIAKRAAPNQPVTFEFRADKPGTFTYYCSLTADEKCKQMKGELVVRARPKSAER